MAGHLSGARLAALRAGESPDDDAAEHLLDCAACARAIEGDTRDDAGSANDALGRALGAARRVEPAPWSENRLRAGQARLAGALRLRRAARYAAPAFAGALAAAAAWSFLHRPPAIGPGASPTLAEVERQPDAALALAQAGPDEVVEVTRGQAAFKVQHLRRAERFRVRCGRDEVEVRGTRFVVHGGGDGFASVEVTEGAVELRTSCCGTRLLRAGESWARPALAAAPGPASAAPGPASAAPGPASAAPGTAVDPASPSPSNAPPPAPGAPGAVGPRPRAPAGRPPGSLEPEAEPTADALRQRALEAYDRGDYALAARSFEGAAQGAPDAPWAPDARTLAGAARVLQASPGAIVSLPVGVASLDAAAQRAARAGDAARASAARVAAARRSSGEGARKRWCALRHDPLTSAEVRAEAARACPDAR